MSDNAAMRNELFKTLAVGSALTFGCLLSPSVVQAQDGDEQLEFFMGISSSSRLQLLDTIPLQFDSYHAQGMTRVGDYYFLSAVEVIENTQQIDAKEDRYDRTAGSGIGHLFKFDSNGALIDQLSLGEGSLYHPGGIDFDGEKIWVSVAEYRPDSRSIVYRIDPDDLRVKEVMRFDDHLGAIVHNPGTSSLHGMNWGAQDHYVWHSARGEFRSTDYELARQAGSNIEYQDCQRLTDSAMLCSGLSSLRIDNTHTLTMGGIDLLDLQSLQVAHQFRFANTTARGELLSRNPFYFEYRNPDSAYLYFVPEDNRANLYIYQLQP